MAPKKAKKEKEAPAAEEAPPAAKTAAKTATPEAKLDETAKPPEDTLGASPPASAPPDTARSTKSSKSNAEMQGFSMPSLMKFLFPGTLEHPECTGRLELFAYYGPANEEGQLRGGIRGGHVHTDLEIRQMISHNCREALFSLFNRPRETVEVIVDTLLPLALDDNYTAAEVKKLLRPVPVDGNGRLDFTAAQAIILENQKRRLKALVNDGISKKERGCKVPFQSEQRDHLLAVTRKKKQNAAEEATAQFKRLHAYTTTLSTLQDGHQAAQLSSNVILCRELGNVNDRWDRYCAVRRSGRSGYVKARNMRRNPCDLADGGMGDKHPGCSSLVATSAHPRGAPLH
mmetsp:Transcript_43128/g.77466  ORF Transcript_43128/g.77466 Transcript_43128/m.77466 type:complete len:344 (-) Transcript_43128:29-1060(-)